MCPHLVRRGACADVRHAYRPGVERARARRRRAPRRARPARRVRARDRLAVPGRTRPHPRARGSDAGHPGDVRRDDDLARRRWSRPRIRRPAVISTARIAYGLVARRAHRSRARGPSRGRLRLLPARHREGGRARVGPVQAGPARRRRVGGHARAPGDRRTDRGADPRSWPARSRSSEPTTSAGTALGYPLGLRGEADPARRSHLRDRRLLRRDDERPALPCGDAARAGARARSAAGAGTQFDPDVGRGLPRAGRRRRLDAVATTVPPSPHAV